METKNDIFSQRVLFAQELARINQDISVHDRRDAMREFGINKLELSKHLRGFGTDLDLSAKLIAFFKPRIAKRYEQAGITTA